MQKKTVGRNRRRIRNPKKLYERMCANMQKDRARHNILPLSKFGLMQITRQRVRPAMDVNTTEICPTCFGKGTIKSSILFTDTLESKIDYLVNKLKVKKFSLHVHPYVAAFINQGLVGTEYPHPPAGAGICRHASCQSHHTQ